VRDAFEIYLSPRWVYAPVERVEGLELMFRTVAPPELDTQAARGIAWFRAALAGAGLKHEPSR
jgi:hypothetical protein